MFAKEKYNNIAHMQYVLDTYLDYVTTFVDYNNEDHIKNPNKEYEKKELEMEIKFGTGKDMKRITRLDYDNVIKRILSAGFVRSDSQDAILRIFATGGSLTNDRIRTEINGIGNISEYCKSNRLTNANGEFIAKIIEKKYFDMREMNPQVDFEDFNFNASLKIESEYRKNIPYLITNEIIKKWEKIKKTFRYINRHTFTHPDYPVKIDISIVKESKRRARGGIEAVVDFIEADVMNSPDRYEIEIEMDSEKLSKHEIKVEYDSGDKLYKVVKKVITLILSGIQRTNYPVSNSEQYKISQEYMAIIFGKNYDTRGMYIKPRNFIGPSSYTLQIENIAIDSDKKLPNIRDNYTVTDKADGERKLLFINGDGRMYFIDSNMNIQFTGCITDNKELRNTLIDGELISHNKKNEFINLYMTFDIYFSEKKDVRNHIFTISQKEKTIISTIDIDSESKAEKKIYRIDLLHTAVKNIQKSMKSIASLSNSNNNTLPFRIDMKRFEVSDSTTSIFECCKSILDDETKGVFEYTIDGLIFTPANFAVGMNSATEVYKPEMFKQTWNSSFKWKPTEYNTIDFLVTTSKENNGINHLFTSGVNASSPMIDYKTVILRVGFDEKKHGYLNPCQDLIDGRIYENDNNEEDKDGGYQPAQFLPTNPSDPNAGICNIALKEDSTGQKNMLSEAKEIIEDKMIVEFRYDKERPEGWRWIPLRVRYDKTADLRANGRNFGNAYHVANSNWHSIHYPITNKMIERGTMENGSDILTSQNEDDEVYYKDDKTSSNQTRGLRDFHNKYVKKMLIQNVSRRGNTLIDLAVGKAGDLHKWISSRLKFVLGIDVSKDNILNRIDGACARYLNTSKTTQRSDMPSALFINGNSTKNIKNGDAVVNPKDKMIINAIFGKGAKDENQLGKGVYRNYGIANDGFDVCSIQFAIHYMFENMNTLTNFLRNVSETTKVGGYFIATCYDGKTIFDKLKNKEKGESEIYNNNDNKKIWSVTKQYDEKRFLDDESSVGYAIDVFQESINKTFREYLVNSEYLNKLLNDYGFVKITHEEAKSKDLPGGSEMFSVLYTQMMNEIQYNPKSKIKYGDAFQMSDIEKNISYLNRYFVYKKINNVNTAEMTSILMKNVIVESSSGVNTSSAVAVAPPGVNTSSVVAVAPPGVNTSSADAPTVISEEKTSAAPPGVNTSSVVAVAPPGVNTSSADAPTVISEEKTSAAPPRKKLVKKKIAKPSVVESAKPSVIESAKPSVVESAKPSVIESAKPSVIEIDTPIAEGGNKKISKKHKKKDKEEKEEKEKKKKLSIKKSHKKFMLI